MGHILVKTGEPIVVIDSLTGGRKIGLVTILSGIRNDGAFEVSFFHTIDDKDRSHEISYYPESNEIVRVNDNESLVRDEIEVRNVSGFGSKDPRLVRFEVVDDNTKAELERLEREGLGMYSYQFDRRRQRERR